MSLVGILKMRHKLSTGPIISLRAFPCAVLHHLNGKSVSLSCKVTDSGITQLLLQQTAIVFLGVHVWVGVYDLSLSSVMGEKSSVATAFICFKSDNCLRRMLI